jgi:hypothetical protein
MKPLRRPDVALRIERLVVSGVNLGPRQAVVLQAAFEGELVRLLERDGFGGPARAAAVQSVPAPAIQLATPFRPAEAGRQIARSVHESLRAGL